MRILATIIISMFCIFLYGQSNIDTYVDKAFSNPALTGFSGLYETNLYTSQSFFGMDNSPSIIGLHFHGPIKEKSGIGMKVSNYRAGIFNDFAIGLSFGHSIQLTGDHYLSIGYGLGYKRRNLNITDLSPFSANDPMLYDDENKENFIIPQAGLSYTYHNFCFGASAEYNLIETSINSTINIEKEFQTNSGAGFLMKMELRYDEINDWITEFSFGIIASKRFYFILGFNTNSSINVNTILKPGERFLIRYSFLTIAERGYFPGSNLHTLAIAYAFGSVENARLSIFSKRIRKQTYMDLID